MLAEHWTAGCAASWLCSRPHGRNAARHITKLAACTAVAAQQGVKMGQELEIQLCDLSADEP